MPDGRSVPPEPFVYALIKVVPRVERGECLNIGVVLFSRSRRVLGGRFELKIYPIPAKGSRTIKIAYTQVVAAKGPFRQYVYPLAHSTDGSTVADNFTVDVEVRGAMPGLVRTLGYDMQRDPNRADVNALRYRLQRAMPSPPTGS